MQDFMDDLSNWYVRRCRERYWGKDMAADKEAAYMTLYTVLSDHGADIRPLHPLHVRDNVSEHGDGRWIQSAPESIHLCDWPKKDESFIDPELEASMAAVLDIVVARPQRPQRGKYQEPPARCLHVRAGQRRCPICTYPS